ncbi:hypothetical protein ABDB91_11550 [Desulfoscipio sp. XC116]|uniref:hypothetical protein n=1 Tax=Desulfoscipio sp. XC116 TaxID=3144975 RepID=UPI00325B3769
MVKRSKLIAMMLIGLMIFTLEQPVLARENNPKAEITPQTYNYLVTTKCFLTDSGNGVLSVTGKTKTYESVDSITTTVYLQKNTSKGWVNVKSWTNSTNNKSSCNVKGTITVAKGYKYRAYCHHRAEKGKSIETNTSNTKAYLVE